MSSVLLYFIQQSVFEGSQVCEYLPGNVSLQISARLYRPLLYCTSFTSFLNADLSPNSFKGAPGSYCLGIDSNNLCQLLRSGVNKIRQSVAVAISATERHNDIMISTSQSLTLRVYCSARWYVLLDGRIGTREGERPKFWKKRRWMKSSMKKFLRDGVAVETNRHWAVPRLQSCRS